MSELQSRAEVAGSLWRQNPALVHLFGLSPLLAVSHSIASGLALGVLALLMLLTLAPILNLLNLPDRLWRFTAFALVTAMLATAIDALTLLYFPAVHSTLQLYILLLAGNLVVFANLESFTRTDSPVASLLRAWRYGTGYLIACVLFGGLREWVFVGALFTDWQILLPGLPVQEAAVLTADAEAETQYGADNLLPMVLILLGLLIAVRNSIQLRFFTSASNINSTPTIKRARVTGRLHRQAVSSDDSISEDARDERDT